MSNHYPVFLADTGILVAFFNRGDRYHDRVYDFIRNTTSAILTTAACIAETMHLLPRDTKVQNELLTMLSNGIIECENLQALDFSRIAELNIRYADMNPDFADLALVTISERLDIPAIATLDSDFDIYRRYRKQPFERVFYP